MNLVKHILDEARLRLVVLSRKASVREAAEILVSPRTPLIVVCDREGVAVGVISTTDIVRAISRAQGDGLNANAETIMTRPIQSCDESQTLQSVWEILGLRSLRCMPVLDDSRRPQGIVHARDLARALLSEVTNEELLLRDYVLGIGYQ